jgi:homoserine dehydrogenase
LEALRVGLCGLGTVGQGVVRLLAENATEISRRAGRPIELVRVASRSAPRIDLGRTPFSTRVTDITGDPLIDVVVEVIGGYDAAEAVWQQAIKNGKHVVSANKALIAERGDALFARAAEAGVGVAFEAAVAGGVPIVKALREGLAANRIQWVAGIINGTTNFILSAMAARAPSVPGRNASAQSAFDEALLEAQALGFAEADPTFDVEGIDAAHKLAILSALAFGTGFSMDGVYTEGIRDISSEDIDYAAALGYRIKHLAIARRSEHGVEIRVHPALVPERRMMAKVDGVMNAVVINSDAAGSTLYYGPGAGASPTASAVVADLIDIARGQWLAPTPRDEDVRRLPIEQVTSAYYLKIPAEDQPGVLAQVAQILSRHAISIEAVIQREQAIRSLGDRRWVPVIILTHRVREQAMNSALAEIQKLAEVVDRITRIRVDALDDHA